MARLCLESVKLSNLISAIRDDLDRAKHSLRDPGTSVKVRRGQNLLLNLRGEAEHAHYLGHPGAGDAFLAGNFGLTGGLTGLQKGLPLDGLVQEFDYPGRPRFP